MFYTDFYSGRSSEIKGWSHRFFLKALFAELQHEDLAATRLITSSHLDSSSFLATICLLRRRQGL
jgi:hypothetical protein